MDPWFGIGTGYPQKQPFPPPAPSVPSRPAPLSAPPSNPVDTTKTVDTTSSQPADVAQIKELGVTQTANGPSSIHCLTVIGQVEGHVLLGSQNKTTKYEHVIPQLIAIEQDEKIKGLLIILNTVGGDVEAGLALAEMIASLSTPTVSLVLGGGHSIGVPIAVAADISFIAPTATMTIHPIRMSGLVIGVPQTYEYLDKMQDRVVKFVTRHSRISADRFRALMFRTGELARDIGTVLVGEDAVREGLINYVGGVSESLAALHNLIAQKEGRSAQ